MNKIKWVKWSRDTDSSPHYWHGVFKGTHFFTIEGLVRVSIYCLDSEIIHANQMYDSLSSAKRGARSILQETIDLLGGTAKKKTNWNDSVVAQVYSR